MKNLYTKTLNQILAEDVKVIETAETTGKMTTQKGAIVTIWQEISKHIFKPVESFRTNINL